MDPRAPLSHAGDLERTLAASGIAAYELDLATNTIRWNEPLPRMFGFAGIESGADVSVFRDAILPEDLSALDAAIARAFADGRAFRQGFRIRHGTSGEVRRLVVRGMHVVSPAGEALRITGLVADVTTRDEHEESLRLSEARHRILFEANPVPIFIVHPTTLRYLMVNAAAARLADMSTAELEALTPGDLVIPEDRPLVERVLADPTPGVRELPRIRFRRRDGSIRHATGTMDRTRFGGEEVVIVSVTDVTRQVEAEDALRESEHRLALALDASSDGLWDWDLETGRVYHSARWARMLGYEPEEIPDSYDAWSLLIHPEDAGAAEHAFAVHAAGGSENVEMENRMRRRDGTWATILVRAKIVARDALGAPLRVVGTHTDITTRRDAERALARQAEVLDTILSNIPIMICFLRPDGSFEYVNRCWVETIGWPLADMAGRDMLAELYPDPEYRADAAAFMARAEAEWADWRVVTRSGRVLRTAWTNVRLADGRLIGIGQDVSDRRAAEEERRRLAVQLQHAQKLESLGVMAGGIAHDFNNLLVGILGNASLAEELLEPHAAAAPLIADVRTAATRAAELTRQLLAYAGKGRFVVERVQLSTLVEEMAALLRPAVSARATLRTELARDLPDVEADATQMRQIVMNLITNASDALDGQAGVVTIRTGTMVPDEEFMAGAIGAPDLPVDTYAFVEVQDTGHGMDEATVARIFDPFFSTKFTGRGLGLAAALGIVRSHRGAIRVRTAVGIGTAIRIVLPALGRTSLPITRALAPADSRWQAEGLALLADDEPTVRGVAARALVRLGMTVVECVDGKDALDRFLESPSSWRLVMLDLTMPRLAGDAALVRMREQRPDVPVILCSGYSQEELDRSLRDLQHVAFLQKPFTASGLSDAVRAALNGS